MFEVIYNFLTRKIDLFLQKNWLLKTTLCSLVCSVLFSSPSFSKLQSLERSVITKLVENQIDHPFVQQNHNAESHYSKRAFRLFMPIVAKTLHLSVSGLLILQAIFGVLFFYFSAKLLYRYSNEKIGTFLFVVGLSGIYLGKSFFLDYWLFFDGVAFFFILLSMYFRNPILIFLSISCAFWTDERSLGAAFAIMVFHLFVSNKKNGSFDWALKQLIPLFVALCVYVFMRIFLSTRFGLTIAYEGIGPIWSIQNFVKYMPLAIFMFFESYWLLILSGFLYLIYKADDSMKIMIILFVLILLGQMIVALSVGDMVRSGTYAFVFCYISYFIIQSFESNKKVVNSIMLLVASLAYLVPSYSVFGNKTIWMRPEFFVLF